MAVLLYCFRHPLLRSMGSILVYESALKPVDIIVVLGGGGADRTEKAIELVKGGYADQILFTIPKEAPPDVPYSQNLNMESRICQAILNYHNIPVDSIRWVGEPFYSTYDEAIFINTLMDEKNYQSIVIVPGYFQSRRAKWTLDHFSHNTDREILVAPADAGVYSATNWWQHVDGIITVENELLKTPYYLLKLTLNRFR